MRNQELRRRQMLLAAAAGAFVLLGCAVTSDAATYYWGGIGGTTDWGTAGNWTEQAPSTSSGAAAGRISGGWPTTGNHVVPTSTDVASLGPWPSDYSGTPGITMPTLGATDYSVNKLMVQPRRTDFGSTYNLTLNSTGGKLTIGNGGFELNGGTNLPPTLFTTVNINPAIVLGANQIWNASANPNGVVTFAGAITGNYSITRNSSGGPSWFTFSNAANSFNGFTHAAGTTRIGADSAADGSAGPLGLGMVDLNGGTFSSSSGSTRTLRNAVRIGGNLTLGQTGTGTGGTGSGTGALVFDSPNTGSVGFNLNSAANGTVRTLTNVVSVTINNGIGQTGGGTGLGLTKAGTGTMTFGGSVANSYTGKTTISAGQLDLNKSGALAIAGDIDVNAGTLRLVGSNQIADTSTVTVASGATFNVNGQTETIGGLKGSGTVGLGAGVLTVGSHLTPGTSPGTVTITGTGGLVLGNGTALNFELSGTSQTVGGGINDLVTTGGNLTLDGILNVTALNSFSTVVAGNSWRLFNYSGTLTNNVVTLGTMPALPANLEWSVDTSVANQVNLVAVTVPEPGIVMAAAVVGMGLCSRRRRAK